MTIESIFRGLTSKQKEKIYLIVGKAIAGFNYSKELRDLAKELTAEEKTTVGFIIAKAIEFRGRSVGTKEGM